MENFDVPEVTQLPEFSSNEEDPTAFADMALASLLKYENGILSAKHTGQVPSVSWTIETCHEGNRTHEIEIAISPSLGSFRSVLARFGHHYMNGQYYSGHALCFLRQRNRTHRCYIYMSNNGQSGFWLRIYAALV